MKRRPGWLKHREGERQLARNKAGQGRVSEGPFKGHVQQGLWWEVGYGEMSGHEWMGRSPETSSEKGWRPQVERSQCSRGKQTDNHPKQPSPRLRTVSSHLEGSRRV